MKYALICAFLVMSSSAFAYLAGPAGASCSGTDKDGKPYSGVQSWNAGSWNGSGGWTCCTAGTSCNKNPQSKPKIQADNPIGPGRSLPKKGGSLAN